MSSRLHSIETMVLAFEEIENFDIKLLIIKHERRKLSVSVVVLMVNCLEFRTLSLVWALFVSGCETLAKSQL